ncbi:MAG: metallophosphoesterase [candidate division WOR-3 bacterium]
MASSRLSGLLRLALFLVCAGCRWDLAQIVCRPTVDERVKASIAGEIPWPEPVEVSRDSFCFAVFGDPQVGSDGKHLLGRFREDIGPKHISFFCVLGDLTNDATEQEVTTIRAALDSVGVPYYATIGNHDLYQKEGWQRFRDNFGPSCYSVTIADRLKLIFLDTAEGTVGERQFAWLEQELSKSRSCRKVVCTHFPCYDGITPTMWRMASTAERLRLESMLSEYRVHAIVSGHIHGWRHTEIAGVHHFIAGTMSLDLDYGTNGYLLFTFTRDSLFWERVEF